MSHVEARPLPTDWLVYGLVAMIVGCAISTDTMRRQNQLGSFAGGRVLDMTPTDTIIHKPVEYRPDPHSHRAWPPEHMRYPGSEWHLGTRLLCTTTDVLSTVRQWYLTKHPEAVVNRESGGRIVLAHPRNSVRLTPLKGSVRVEVFIGHDPTID